MLLASNAHPLSPLALVPVHFCSICCFKKRSGWAGVKEACSHPHVFQEACLCFIAPTCKFKSSLGVAEPLFQKNVPGHRRPSPPRQWQKCHSAFGTKYGKQAPFYNQTTQAMIRALLLTSAELGDQVGWLKFGCSRQINFALLLCTPASLYVLEARATVCLLHKLFYW